MTSVALSALRPTAEKGGICFPDVLCLKSLSPFSAPARSGSRECAHGTGRHPGDKKGRDSPRESILTPKSAGRLPR